MAQIRPDRTVFVQHDYARARRHEAPHAGFDPVERIQHLYDEGECWFRLWDDLNRMVASPSRYGITPRGMRRMVALVLVAAEAEGEREDAEHFMEDVLAFYGWSLRELTMTPAERDRAARSTTGTEVEVVNATGLRPRKSTVTARALYRYRLRRRGIAAILPHRMAVPTITRKTVALRRSQARRGPPARNGDEDPSDDHHVVLRLRLQAIWPRVAVAIKTPAPPAGSSRSTPYASHPDGRLTLPGTRKWLPTSRRSQAAVASTTPGPIHPPGQSRARPVGGTKWH